MDKKDKDYVEGEINETEHSIYKKVALAIEDEIKSHERRSWGHSFWIGCVIFGCMAILTLGVVIANNQFAGMEWHCTGDKVTVYSAVCHVPYSDEGKLFVPEKTITIRGDKDSFDRSIKTCQENGWRITDFAIKEVCTGYEYLMRT